MSAESDSKESESEEEVSYNPLAANLAHINGCIFLFALMLHLPNPQVPPASLENLLPRETKEGLAVLCDETPSSSGGRKKKKHLGSRSFDKWMDHDKDLPAMSGMAAVNHHCKFIAVYNYKGGVGKTTTVKELAGTLALLGKRVAMMDADYQCNLTSSYLPRHGQRHAASGHV